MSKKYRRGFDYILTLDYGNPFTVPKKFKRKRDAKGYARRTERAVRKRDGDYPFFDVFIDKERRRK